MINKLIANIPIREGVSVDLAYPYDLTKDELAKVHRVMTALLWEPPRPPQNPEA